MRRITLYTVLTINLISILFIVFLEVNIYTLMFLALSLFLFYLTTYDINQKKHSLTRNFPILARLRWVFESQRDKIRQYFNESDTDGKPFSREKRSIAYQRSKKELETVPFGTEHDVNERGYEFIEHSMYPKESKEIKGDRVIIGSDKCKIPYSSSILNISAMSYGSLSEAAIRALNLGAKKGNFSHNTGEGGISPYHLLGGDLVFQIGTGYFGAGKTIDGKRYFDETSYAKNAIRKEVKMIELKISQGAKPGHGGILPASKNTKEISQIRGINPHVRVESPPAHTAFHDSKSLIQFIEQLRFLSGGKPVGIKICVGKKEEIEDMFKMFKKMNNYPDYISVDGSEGGTGSAPLEHTNHVGYPLKDGLIIIIDLLKKYGLRNKIKVIASGKIIDGFDIIKTLSIGADVINMARGFMFSMGCIQARECNKNTCPVGIATQNKQLIKGLVVEEKFERVYNFHSRTVEVVKDLIGTMGVEDISSLDENYIKEME